MITIDDPEVEQLVRERAARTGASVEQVVREAVHAHVSSQAATAVAAEASPEEQARRHAILLEFRERFDQLPVLDARSADEIIGYDENGLPT